MCNFQAMKLIFHTFRTHDSNDPVTIYDRSGTEVYSVLYGIQTGRPDIVVYDHGAYISFITIGGGQTTGFKLEYQCYNLTANGTYLELKIIPEQKHYHLLESFSVLPPYIELLPS